MREVMNDCVIMHNMIVEDNRDDSLYDQERMNMIDLESGSAMLQEFLHVHYEIRDQATHIQL
jgi:hypothetical protein